MTAERNVVNAAVVTTQTSLSGSAGTTLTLGSATNWPAAPFTAVLEPGTANMEAITVGARSGTSCSSITRGVDGTTAITHTSGCVITHEVTARDYMNAKNILDVYRNAAFTPTVGSSSVSVLQFDTTVKDNFTSGSAWTTGNALRFPIAGTYTALFSLHFASLSTANFHLCQWRLNASGSFTGGTLVKKFSWNGQNTDFDATGAFRIEGVSAGDTLEAFPYTSVTAALTVGDKNSTYCRLQWISE